MFRWRLGFGAWQDRYNDGYIKMTGSNAQQISGTGYLPSLTVEKSGDTLTIANDITLLHDFHYNSGTIDWGSYKLIMGHNASTFNSPLLYGGGITIPKLEISINSANTLGAYETTTVTELTLTEGDLNHVSGQVFQVTGDVTVGASWGSSDTGNDGTLRFTGGSDQTVTYNTGATMSKAIINKDSATDVVSFTGTGAN